MYPGDNASIGLQFNVNMGREGIKKYMVLSDSLLFSFLFVNNSYFIENIWKLVT